MRPIASQVHADAKIPEWISRETGNSRRATAARRVASVTPSRNGNRVQNAASAETRLAPKRNRADRSRLRSPRILTNKKPSGNQFSYVYKQILLLKYLRPMRSLRCVASRTQSSRSLKSHGGQPWGETPKTLLYASTIAGTGSSFKSSRALRFACSRSALIFSSS